MNGTESQLARLADDDLAEAEHAAALLGMQIGHVAALRAQLEAGTDVATVAAEAREVRASLRAAELERNALLARWTVLPVRLGQLDAAAAVAAALVARCGVELASPPPLSVPPVAAVRRAVEDVAAEELGDLTWPALRGRLTPVVAAVDRLAAELADLDRRCRALLGDAG